MKPERKGSNRGRKKGQRTGTPAWGLAKHAAEVSITDLRRELVAALYVDRETLATAFRSMLAERPYEAFRVLVSLMPKDITVEQKTAELPPLVQSIRAAMADVQAIVEVKTVPGETGGKDG